MISQIGLYDSRLKKIISKNPGIHYRGIYKIAKLSNGSLQRNLKRLEESNSIKVFREIGRTRYFDNKFSDRYVDEMSILQRTTLRNIVKLLLENDKLLFKEIVDASKLSPGTISYSLTELGTKGFLEKSTESKNSISFKLKNRQRIKTLLNNLDM